MLVAKIKTIEQLLEVVLCVRCVPGFTDLEQSLDDDYCTQYVYAPISLLEQQRMSSARLLLFCRLLLLLLLFIIIVGYSTRQ